MLLLKRINKKINREYKYFSTDVKHTLGLNETFFKNARGQAIVCYHGICNSDPLKFNTRFLTQKVFDSHLQFYRSYFNVVSLEQFYTKDFSKDKFNICISFDDGYYNNYKYVLPLLKTFKLPAAFFITAIRDAGYNILWNDFLDIATKYGPKQILFKKEQFKKGRLAKYISCSTGSSLAQILRNGNFSDKAALMQTFNSMFSFEQNLQDQDYWQQMNEQQIKELSECSYCTIGSHGYYHNDLVNINSTELKDEMYNSKKYLENIINKNIDSLAFPYGSYSKDVVTTAKELHYNKLLCIDSSREISDSTIRERIIVNPYISVANQMMAIIRNSYE